MKHVVDLPVDHAWVEAKDTDTLLFYCGDCDIHVPVTAADTQAGIRLFCPGCDDDMEMIR